MSYPNPDCNIYDIHPKIKRKICESLDVDSKWRTLATLVEGGIFQLSVKDIEKCAKAYQRLPGTGNDSATGALWSHYSGLGMKVHQLIDALDRLQSERELMYLKPPENLEIIQQPENMTILSGQKCQIVCKAKGFPYPRYRWVHQGCDEKVTRVRRGDKCSLEFKKIKKKHEGHYICQIYNTLTLKAKRNGQSTEVLETSPIYLKVIGDAQDSTSSDDNEEENHIPVYNRVNGVIDVRQNREGPKLKITEQSSDIHVKELETLSLYCYAEGSPTPEYQWYRNNNKIQNGRKPRLEIKQCSYACHSGQYYCTVYNGKTLDSKKITVKIIPADSLIKDFVIIRQPEFQKVGENNKAHFEFKFQTKGSDVNCVWYHSSNTYSNASRPVEMNHNKSVTLTNVNEHYVSQFTINNAKYDDEGKYYCTVFETIHGKPRSNLSQTVKLYVERRHLSVENPVAKLALLIGVGQFKNQHQLSSVKYDIFTAAGHFKKMGYQVFSLMDLTLEEMNKSVDLFCNLICSGTYVTLYFVSHGFMHQGNHYMMPWDAMSGPQLDEFLCLEEVFCRVQSHEPLFVFMVVDMCRIKCDYQLASPPEMARDFKPKKNGNNIIVYSTSKYEQAFGPEDRVGVFCGIFSKVLEKYKNKPILEMFDKYITEEFKIFLANDGKEYPMIPEIIKNCLNPNISFVDAIEPREGGVRQREERLKRIQSLNTLPKNVTANIEVNSLQIAIVFQQKFSNVLLMIAKVEAIGPEVTVDSITLDTSSAPDLNIQTETYYQTEWRFEIKDLQRLKSDFQPALDIKYTRINDNKCHETKIARAELSSIACMNRPLISSSPIWSGPNYVRQPTEDEEPPSSLEDQVATN